MRSSKSLSASSGSVRLNLVFVWVRKASKGDKKPQCLYILEALLPLRSTAISSTQLLKFGVCGSLPESQLLVSTQMSFFLRSLCGYQTTSTSLSTGKRCSSETPAIACRTSGFKLRTRSARKKANIGFLWTSEVSLFNLHKIKPWTKTA